MSSSPPPPIRCFITTHDADGKAIFAKDVSTEVNVKSLGPVQAADLYATTSMPASNDPSSLNSSLSAASAPRMVDPSGTKFKIIEFPPGAEASMHRTVTLDYLIIISGEIEVELDSGEKQTLRSGDTLVQRGTSHKWKNHGTDWVRMAGVVVDAEKVEVGGKTLDWDISDVPLSKD